MDLYRHAESLDFMQVFAYQSRTVLKVLVTYFCRVGLDFIAYKTGLCGRGTEAPVSFSPAPRNDLLSFHLYAPEREFIPSHVGAAFRHAGNPNSTENNKIGSTPPANKTHLDSSVNRMISF